MKLNKNILTIGFLSLMLYNTPFIAQNSRFDVIQKELTKQQRDLLQNEKEVMKANRKAFKASLTKEQMTILRDKTVSKNERRKRLSATFSIIQKEMVKNQQVSLRKTRDNFRKTLTGEQRKMLKERIDKIRKYKDRGELKGGLRLNKANNGKKKRNKGN
jgi:hypothetical protein